MQKLDYILRQATEQDYEFIYQVKKEAYQEYVELNFGSWDEEQQRSYFKKFMESCKANAYIITLDSTDIGFYNDEIVDSKYEIGNICILPAYRHKGIGTALLTDMIKKYSDKEIHLQYFKQNPVAKLYQRLGFQLVGETTYHYQMRKEATKQ